MAQIILTNHVRQKAAERAISLAELDKTIRFPDQVIQSKTSTSKKHLKTFSAYTIVVPIKRQGNDWITISVWKKTPSSRQTKQIYKKFFLQKIIEDFLLHLEKIFSPRS